MEWEGRKALSECINAIISWAAALTSNQPVLQCKHQFARNGQFSEFHIFAPQKCRPWKVPPGATGECNPPRSPPPAATAAEKYSRSLGSLNSFYPQFEIEHTAWLYQLQLYFCIYGLCYHGVSFQSAIGIKSHKTVRKLSKNRLQLGSLRCSSRLTSRINPNSYSTSLTIASRPVCPLPRICWLHHCIRHGASANNSKQWHRQGREGPVAG